MIESGEKMELSEKVNNLEKEVVKLNSDMNNVKSRLDNHDSSIKSVETLCNQLEKFMIRLDARDENQDKIIKEMKEDKKKLNWYLFTTICGFILTAIWTLIVNK